MNNEDFIKRIKEIQDCINARLTNLAKCKLDGYPIKIDDIDQRINACVQAIDNLEQSINHVLGNATDRH